MERRKYDEFNYVSQKKLPFLKALYDLKSTNLFTGDDSLHELHVHPHKYNRNNYNIRPHLDSRWFFLYGGSSTTTGVVKNYYYLPPLFLINKLYSNVDGALKFMQNDIIYF